MYSFIEKTKNCYQLLEDDLSKKIFCERMICDIDPSTKNVGRLVSLGEQQAWLDEFFEKTVPMVQNGLSGKKLVLYGTAVTGCAIATQFFEKNIDFYGFCGRRAGVFLDGLMGKPVISPEYLFEHKDEFSVILTVTEAYNEIMSILKENDFPLEQVISILKRDPNKPEYEVDHQYFEFPTLFKPGTAFVDGGCLDCRSSYLFADWCKGAYSNIYAFEPDPISFSICEKNLSKKALRNLHLVRAGLSDHEGEVSFKSGLYGESHIADDTNTPDNSLVVIPVTTIDGTVGADTVGFIKMDIEGSEFAALHGAKGVIVRDKPLLALSVYHRPGDMMAIIEYLHALVPEYRFWLRHYSIGFSDTVLYASIYEL